MLPLRDRVDGFLRHRVREALAPREALLPPLQEELVQARTALEALDRRARAQERALAAFRAESELWSRPFGPDLTVHQAWTRHPRAREVFARHHLPACDHCAVRFDETVGEAAAAYGLDPVRLVDELNALLVRG